MIRVFWVLIALLTALPGGLAAAGKEGSKKEGTPQIPIVAVVGNWNLRLDQVDRGIAAQIYELESQLYRLRMQAIQEHLAKYLLAQEAKTTGSTAEAIMEKEVTAKVPEITADDVKRFIEKNKSRLPNGGEGMEDRVKTLISEATQEKILAEYMTTLARKYEARVDFPAPVAPRFKVDTPSDTSKGPEKAAITLVEFSDFECPYCKRATEVVNELEKAYSGKIRIIFRQFPMPGHAHAAKAAEASLCAADQKKFWAYHDNLFAHNDKMADDDLKSYASQAGLDVGKFTECMDSGRNIARIKKDIQEGTRMGITGTPTFFVNGIRVVGAQPLEEFKALIDAELSGKNKN